jgi:hypothetical protein
MLVTVSIIVAYVLVGALAQNDWFKSRPQPLRTFYVSRIAEHPVRKGTRDQVLIPLHRYQYIVTNMLHNF